MNNPFDNVYKMLPGELFPDPATGETDRHTQMMVRPDSYVQAVQERVKPELTELPPVAGQTRP